LNGQEKVVVTPPPVDRDQVLIFRDGRGDKARCWEYRVTGAERGGMRRAEYKPGKDPAVEEVAELLAHAERLRLENTELLKDRAAFQRKNIELQVQLDAVQEEAAAEYRRVRRPDATAAGRTSLDEARVKLWADVCVAVAGISAMTDDHTPARWADMALAAFDRRFPAPGRGQEAKA